MGKFSLYNISLRGEQADVQEFNYDLNAAFFQAIEAEDVSRGNVSAVLTVKKQIDRFEFVFALDGTVLIPCNRCLDDIHLPILTRETLYVKFGDAYSEEGDNIIVIPETEGEINVAWFLYEFIALQIPIKHVHAAGECNKTMMGKLKKYRVIDKNEDKTNGGDQDDFGDEGADSDDDIDNTDPRWDKLKNILDNN